MLVDVSTLAKEAGLREFGVNALDPQDERVRAHLDDTRGHEAAEQPFQLLPLVFAQDALCMDLLHASQRCAALVVAQADISAFFMHRLSSVVLGRVPGSLKRPQAAEISTLLILNHIPHPTTILQNLLPSLNLRRRIRIDKIAFKSTDA